MFTPGTLIATERGQRPVEQLCRGDRVVTRDHGLKRVAWIGRCDLTYHDLNSAKRLRPVLVRKGALDSGRPKQDMLVSPHHRFSLRGQAGEFISARDLTARRGVVPASALGVSYLHFLCNAHEVILANGAWTESFHPDDAVMKEHAPEQRREILSLFPEVATMGAAKRFKPVRPAQDHSRFET